MQRKLQKHGGLNVGRGKPVAAIPVWSGVSDNQLDPRIHYWYKVTGGQIRRICDDFVSSSGIQEPAPTQPLIPCKPCQDLYVQDIAFGRHVLEQSPRLTINPPENTTNSMVYSSKSLVSTMEVGELDMLEHPRIGMATFARFYDASASEKTRLVREARGFLIDREHYTHRAYYYALLNTLSHTHWYTKDIADFENERDAMLAHVSTPHRVENYRKVSEAYISFWHKQQDAQFFRIPVAEIEIAGLTILINPEVGLRRHGDELVLKLWLSALPPKRSYRQAVQYLMEQAQRQGWQQHSEPALWDVRREEIMPHVRTPRDFAMNILGQAAAFRQMWDSLGLEDGTAVNMLDNT